MYGKIGYADGIHAYERAAFCVLLCDAADGADAIGNAISHAQIDHVVPRRLQQTSKNRIGQNRQFFIRCTFGKIRHRVDFQQGRCGQRARQIKVETVLDLAHDSCAIVGIVQTCPAKAISETLEELLQHVGGRIRQTARITN